MECSRMKSYICMMRKNEKSALTGSDTPEKKLMKTPCKSYFLIITMNSHNFIEIIISHKLQRTSIHLRIKTRRHCLYLYGILTLKFLQHLIRFLNYSITYSYINSHNSNIHYPATLNYHFNSYFNVVSMNLKLYEKDLFNCNNKLQESIPIC
jgi:hypothetical protein